MQYKIRARTLHHGTYAKLVKEYKAVLCWTITNHCAIKLDEREFAYEDLFRVIDEGEFTEYHTMKDTRRAVVKQDNLCVVLDLDDKAIITVFKSNELGQKDNQLFGGI